MPSLAMELLSSLPALDRPSQSSMFHAARSIVEQAAGTPPVAAPSVPYQPLVLAWIILQLAGQISLPILILTMIFHKGVARRNPTIINLCIVWSIATIPPELLFYTGKYKGPQPSPMLCLLQAATISGVPPMAATAYFGVVFHACSVIYEINREVTVRPFTVNLRMLLILASPYVAFFAFSMYIAFVGAANPRDIFRDEFFCVVGNAHLSTPVFAFTVAMVGLTLIAQGWILYTCYLDYRAKRQRQSNFSGKTVSGIDIQFLFRMFAFTIFEVVIVVACLITMFSPQLEWAKLMLATPPFATFLIFATSQDILCAWFPCFFRRDHAALTRSSSVLAVSRSSRHSRDLLSNKGSSISGFSKTHYSQSSSSSLGSYISSPSPSFRGPMEREVQSQLPPPLQVYISRGPRDFRQEPDESTIQVQSYRQQSPMETMRSFKATTPPARTRPR